MKYIVHTLLVGLLLLWTASGAHAATAASNEIVVPINRSALVTSPIDMAEVLVANPEIADVHAHGTTNLSILGKKMGRTNIRIFDKANQLIRTIDVAVGPDLPAMRKALKDFLPGENINVELVNMNVALTGQATSSLAVDRALKVVREFMQSTPGATPAAAGGAEGTTPNDGILNLIEVTSSQQVMLRVRVGELQRDALRRLGIDLSSVSVTGAGNIAFETGAALTSAAAGTFTTPSNARGVLTGLWQPNGASGDTAGGMLAALERDGIFKVLAEPNLVAISGEQAEFLAGGEIPIPVVQPGSGGSTASVSIEYKPVGVAVKFTPYVLTENRIRMIVQPEVSEVSTTGGTSVGGTSVPAINTRRTKTTIELAPGESFMIAGLIKDTLRSSIDQIPGAKELPILGALFRSTEYQRNETELVITVTPYLVDPMKAGDIKLPTDQFAPSSQMEMFFYGALGALSGGVLKQSQTPPLEGPVGFMVE